MYVLKCFLSKQAIHPNQRVSKETACFNVIAHDLKHFSVYFVFNPSERVLNTDFPFSEAHKTKRFPASVLESTLLQIRLTQNQLMSQAQLSHLSSDLLMNEQLCDDTADKWTNNNSSNRNHKRTG